MERKFDSKTQRTERKGFEGKGKSSNKNTFKFTRSDRKSSGKTTFRKAKFLIGPMLPKPEGVLASILLQRYVRDNYLIDEEFITTNKAITDKLFDGKLVNYETKMLEILSREKNCIIRHNFYKNVFYNLTAIILTKETEQIKKWAPSYLNNINAIAELFSRNDATKELTNRINKFGDVVKEIINKNKIEGTDKEKVKEVMASINTDGIDTSNLGFIQKELVNRFQNYMDNALMFTSMHIGLPNFSNCVLFFDKPIAEDLFASLPTDYRRILFVNMFNFKLFNTDNIALINKPIVDVMLTEGETEYTKLSDPELLKKPIKAKKPFVKKDNKFGGNKNGYMGKSKESGKSWK